MDKETVLNALDAACRRALEQGVTLRPNGYGITIDFENQVVIPDGDGCCVFGACMLGRKWTDIMQLIQDIEKELGLNPSHTSGIINGFDQRDHPLFPDDPDWVLGREIGAELHCRYVQETSA